MPIVSISMDEKTLAGMDSLREELGLSGRSEAVRAGVRSLISENRKLGKLAGRIKAVLLLVHEEKAEGSASRIRHEFGDAISTQIHSNLKGSKCLEIFILEGEAARVRELVRAAQASGKMERVRLVLP